MDLHWSAALAAVIGLGLGAWLALRVRALRERSRARERGARARRGEQRAKRVLEAAGYRIRSHHEPICYQVQVEGAPQQVELIVDYMVEDEGELLVAEVKTGSSPISISNPDTRRQLLEYQLATHTRRVLLVDPEADTITEVAFPMTAPPAARPKPDALPGRSARWWVLILFVVLIGVVSWFYLQR